MRTHALFLTTALAAGLLAAAPTAAAAPSGLSGDFNGDGHRDLALAAPYAALPGKGMSGYAAVGYGTSAGISTAKRTVVHQDSTGVPGSAEAEDAFGAALAVADTNGDGYGELAIGVVFEDIGEDEDTGSVVVMRGSAAGVSGTGAKNLTQSTSGVPGAAEDMDYFGSDVHLSDVTRDGRADLAVTAGFENEGVGAVWTLRSTTAGVSTAGAKSFGSSAVGMPTEYGAFGANLAN
ncbi:FG-GAP repeat protein [Streptomyces sp. Wb2n-11]|uniref:FG-GAP repeat protein n=1 Tax=Streptomyces sp. Wb2n-11 TaxID=1030533 RepID=UPI000B313E02|nr:FG-GAP repeat protein [Streptomyces sp. Wb2n-11]